MRSGWAIRARWAPGSPGCFPCRRPDLVRFDWRLVVWAARASASSRDGGSDEFPEFRPWRCSSSAIRASRRSISDRNSAFSSESLALSAVRVAFSATSRAHSASSSPVRLAPSTLTFSPSSRAQWWMIARSTRETYLNSYGWARRELPPAAGPLHRLQRETLLLHRTFIDDYDCEGTDGGSLLDDPLFTGRGDPQGLDLGVTMIRWDDGTRCGVPAHRRTPRGRQRRVGRDEPPHDSPRRHAERATRRTVSDEGKKRRSWQGLTVGGVGPEEYGKLYARSHAAAIRKRGVEAVEPEASSAVVPT